MKKSPNLEVRVFTIDKKSEKEFESLISGTCKYQTKITQSEELLVAINNAIEVSPTIKQNTAKTMVVLFGELDGTQKENQKVLSNREKEVLSYLALGKRYKQIAEALFLSVHTVRYHIKKIYSKFNIHSQSEAIILAAKNGLI